MDITTVGKRCTAKIDWTGGPSLANGEDRARFGQGFQSRGGLTGGGCPWYRLGHCRVSSTIGYANDWRKHDARQRASLTGRRGREGAWTAGGPGRPPAD